MGLQLSVYKLEGFGCTDITPDAAIGIIVKFTKMHGLGNDFIITEEYKEDLVAAAKRMCPRRTSVGADGVIAVCPSEVADVRMRIINADGSEAEMCGNGIRCFARYVYDKGIVSSPSMSVETAAGIMYPELIKEDGRETEVRVNMGKPDFEASSIPVDAEDPLNLSIDIDGAILPGAAVLMGVPHAVMYVNSIDENTIAQLGSAVESHKMFPRHTNVNFVEMTGPDTIKIRTWERGAGRTMACGTGSCAAAVICHRKGVVGSNVTAELDAGRLQIEISEDSTVYMTGPAEYVYEGLTC